MSAPFFDQPILNSPWRRLELVLGTGDDPTIE